MASCNGETGRAVGVVFIGANFELLLNLNTATTLG
jgi:hypothetical protein